jgi:hypothetical protein
VPQIEDTSIETRLTESGRNDTSEFNWQELGRDEIPVPLRIPFLLRSVLVASPTREQEEDSTAVADVGLDLGVRWAWATEVRSGPSRAVNSVPFLPGSYVSKQTSLQLQRSGRFVCKPFFFDKSP